MRIAGAMQQEVTRKQVTTRALVNSIVATVTMRTGVTHLELRVDAHHNVMPDVQIGCYSSGGTLKRKFLEMPNCANFRQLPLSVALRTLAVVSALAIGSGVHAATLTVTNTNDLGPGSLREALGNAIADDLIEFDAALAGQTILLLSPLNTFTENLTINSTAALGLTISGSSLVLNGAATLSLIGDTNYVGDLQVAVGTVVVSGTISGDTTVQSGGRLGGSGTINGVTTSVGTLNAGTGMNEIATLSFADNLTINGGTMQVDINAGGTVPGVNNDLYTVDGDVVIDGATLEVNTVPASYVDGATYTFLTATGTITGTFGNFIDDLPFFALSMFYNVNSVSFRLNDVNASFEQIATGCNQASVGAYLDFFKPTAIGDLNDVIDALRRSNTSQIQMGLDQLGGQIYPTLVSSQLQHTTFSVAMLRDQLVLDTFHRQSKEGSRAWIRGYGIGGDTDQDDCGTKGYNYSLGGTEIALQRGFESGLELGVFTNLSWSRIETNGLAQQADVDSYQLGGNIQYTGNYAYGLGIGGAGYQQYDVNREISLAGGLADRTASSNFDGQQAFGYFESGLMLPTGSITWVPHSSMQYVTVDQGSIRETGADSVNLVGQSLSTDSLRSILGLSIQSSGPTPLGLATTKLRLGWMHEYLDTNERFEAKFIGETRSFEVQGVDLGQDWAVIGGNLQWALFNYTTAIFAYQGQVNSTQSLHTGALGLEVRW